MTLKKYIKKLIKIIEENPEYADLDIVYSGDDEGNTFNKVIYAPSIGYFNNDDKNFIGINQFKDWDINDKPNAVCIN